MYTNGQRRKQSQYIALPGSISDTQHIKRATWWCFRLQRIRYFRRSMESFFLVPQVGQQLLRLSRCCLTG